MLKLVVNADICIFPVPVCEYIVFSAEIVKLPLQRTPWSLHYPARFTPDPFPGIPEI